MNQQQPWIIPEPVSVSFTGRWLHFDGVQEAPDFLRHEMHVPHGRYVIHRDTRAGTGVEIRFGRITIWGDENTCWATLCQLMLQRNGHIPEITVVEQPRFAFRGFHLDIARGGVPNMPYFKKLLRLLFLCKYNALGIYFEDLFPWERHPQIGAGRGRLTRDELRELIAYGEHLGIEVFPSLELCGHMERILSLPEYARFSEWTPAEGCLNAHDPAARHFACELLEEAVDFFANARHIHVGGDECWALGRGASLDDTRKFRGPEIFEEHHKQLIGIVRKAGKIPIVWGDMMTGMYLDEKRRGLWKNVHRSRIWNDVTVANWDYQSTEEAVYQGKIRLFKDRKQYAAPGMSNWGGFYPEYPVALANNRLFLKAAADAGVDGFLLTSWGDDGAECLYSLAEPLLVAVADLAQGHTAWERKWAGLAHERSEVTEFRIQLGDPSVTKGIKNLLINDSPINDTGVRHCRMLLERAQRLNLPPDLRWVVRYIAAGMKRTDNRLNISDITQLLKTYRELWCAERKTENLDRVVRKFSFAPFTAAETTGSPHHA
jgi:hexosaminidase